MAVPRSSRERPRPRPSHDAILASAEKAFGERGFADTSLRELIAACGCSTTAFYARFATKEAVLETLLRDLLVDLHDAAAQVLPRAKDPAQGFDAGVDVLVAAIKDRRGLLRVALTEAGRIPSARAVMRDAYGMLAALLAGQMTKLVARGRIDVADADALAWALVGALTMQVTRWAVFEELADDELAEALRATARTMLPARRKA
jgi:AcrR family transcriptional regulator